MEQNEFRDLVKQLHADDDAVHEVSIPEDLIASMTVEQAGEIAALFGATTLLWLPAREQAFFEWLRETDVAVWNDLWGADDRPYLVSISFLPELLPKRRGFLICDLVEHQNFFFTDQSITAEDGRIFLDAALDVVHANGQLTMPQAFVVEIWRAPIDLWRFAYTYGQPLDEVKKMVIWLLSEDVLLLPPVEDESVSDETPSTNGLDGE